MNKSQIHISSISNNNNKQSKKSIPISINSNPNPFQYIFNNKKSNLVSSYVNMGNQIQKNKNSNIILFSKKKTAQHLENTNLIIQSYLSKYSVSSLLSKSNYSNKNNTQLKISSYQIFNDINKNLDYPSMLFRTKVNNKKKMKKTINNNINKVINFNNSLKKNNNLKNTNFKLFKNKNENSDEIIINSNYNLSKEKENKNTESTTSNTLIQYKNNIIEQNKSNKVLNTLRNQIHNYFKSDNSLFGSSFINKSKKKKKACQKFERKKLIEKINENYNSIKHYTICKSYKNHYISNNKNKEDKKEENYRNKTISINLNKILKDIKIEKKRNKKNNRKNFQKKLDNPICLNQIIEKEISKEIINGNNKNKLNKKQKDILIIKNEEKISKNHHSYYNDLFDEKNLYEIPDDNDDKFDNLNSIVRKIPFNKVLINCGNLFTINNNKKYFQYFEKFEKEFIENINYDKKDKKGKVVSINQSYSTQQSSSYKKKLLKN